MEKLPPVNPPKNPGPGIISGFPTKQLSHSEVEADHSQLCTILHLRFSYVSPPSGDPKIPYQKLALSLEGAAILARQLKDALHECGALNP